MFICRDEKQMLQKEKHQTACFSYGMHSCMKIYTSFSLEVYVGYCCVFFNQMFAAKGNCLEVFQ